MSETRRFHVGSRLRCDARNRGREEETEEKEEEEECVRTVADGRGAG